MKPLGALTDDFLNDFRVSDIDNSSPKYFGFLRKDGAWYIMKVTTTGNVDAYRYYMGVTDYATAWGNRTSLTPYGLFSVVF